MISLTGASIRTIGLDQVQLTVVTIKRTYLTGALVDHAVIIEATKRQTRNITSGTTRQTLYIIRLDPGGTGNIIGIVFGIGTSADWIWTVSTATRASRETRARLDTLFKLKGTLKVTNSIVLTIAETLVLLVVTLVTASIISDSFGLF